MYLKKCELKKNKINVKVFDKNGNDLATVAKPLIFFFEKRK